MGEKIKNIPELRFPEFGGEWEEKNLGQLIDRLDAGISVNSVDRIAKNHEMAILKTSCVFTSVFDVSQNKAVTEEKEISRLKEPVTANTIIISRMNTPTLVGANAYVSETKENVFLPDRLWAAKINPSANSYWISLLLSSKKIRLALSNRATGTSNSMKNITKDDVLTLSIYAPLLPEQQKIADFLTSVDTRIELLTQQKEKLEQYKNGIMQKIFNREIRFKDDNGKAFPDWEEKKLGEIAKVVVGGTPSTAKREYWNGNIGWIGSGELKNKHIKEPTKYITELGLKKSSTYLMPKGTVLLAMTGATLGKIGILDFDCTGNQSVAGFIPEISYSSLFLFYILQNEGNQIMSYAGGAAQAGINKNNIENLKVKFPSKEEQQKIASFLSAIDKQIEKIAVQIEKTKEFKKGLLQQMFV